MNAADARRSRRAAVALSLPALAVATVVLNARTGNAALLLVPSSRYGRRGGQTCDWRRCRSERGIAATARAVAPISKDETSRPRLLATSFLPNAGMSTDSLAVLASTEAELHEKCSSEGMAGILALRRPRWRRRQMRQGRGGQSEEVASSNDRENGGNAGGRGVVGWRRRRQRRQRRQEKELADGDGQELVQDIGIGVDSRAGQNLDCAKGGILPKPWHRFRVRRRRDGESLSLQVTQENGYPERKGKRGRASGRRKPRKQEEDLVPVNKDAVDYRNLSSLSFTDHPQEMPIAKGSINENNSIHRDREGKRVVFSSSHESTRPILLNSEKTAALLNEYMTLPVEQYSVKGFHDAEYGTFSGESTKAPGSRRWLLRRLAKDELYWSVDEQEGPFRVDGVSENCFRLAVPLMPLIGWELTPVIDLEVIPAEHSADILDENVTLSSLDDSSIAKDSPLSGLRRKIAKRKARGGDKVDDPESIRIKSLRVSLLLTEDEVQEIMSERPKPTATKVSQNQNVQMMGNEVIGMVGKVEEFLRPHVFFEASITWCDGISRTGDARLPRQPGRQQVGRKSERPSVSVKALVETSLTIPKLPMAVPVPSRFLVKKIGSTVMTKALSIALPRFLAQLEADFERWAKIDSMRGDDILSSTA